MQAGIRRGDGFRFMAKHHQYPRPEVCRAASFHANQAWCLASEKLKNLSATEAAADIQTLVYRKRIWKKIFVG